MAAGKRKYSDEWLGQVQGWLDQTGRPVRDAADHYGMTQDALGNALRRYRARRHLLSQQHVNGCNIAAEAPITRPPPLPLPGEYGTTRAEVASTAPCSSGPDVSTAGHRSGGATPPDGGPVEDRKPRVQSARGAPDRADELIERMVQCCRTRPRTIGEVCDELHIWPERARKLLAWAQADGYGIGVSGDTIAWQAAECHDDSATVDVEPSTNDELVLAVISDTHFGSSHCMREHLADFMAYAYDQGARIALHSGDMLAGHDATGRLWHWDLSHHGLDAQIDDAFEHLPQHDGLQYHFIDGNHDETFWKRSGQVTGRRVVEAFASRGRNDLAFHGIGGAYVALAVPGIERPILIHLWHPSGGVPYALSYRLQEQISRGYAAPGTKPDLLLAGHLHQMVYVCHRGVHGLLVPCWESPNSAFSKRIGKSTTVGGIVVRLRLTRHGTLRSVALDPQVYYHRESPRAVEWQAA